MGEKAKLNSVMVQRSQSSDTHSHFTVASRFFRWCNFCPETLKDYKFSEVLREPDTKLQAEYFTSECYEFLRFVMSSASAGAGALITSWTSRCRFLLRLRESCHWLASSHSFFSSSLHLLSLSSSPSVHSYIPPEPETPLNLFLKESYPSLHLL